MDVVKLWSNLLANCAIGTANVCSIPAAYFMQGTADVQVFSGYANETSSSIDSDDSNPYQGADETPEDAANGEEVGDGNGREEDEIDDLGDDGEEGECVEETPMENEEGIDDEDASRKRQTKIQRNRYSREEYRCTMCPYTCTTEKAFLRHLRCCESKDKKENAQLQLSCPICGKDRKGEQSLSIHMKKHKDNKHFCCDICKFKTLQLKKLIQHRRMHTGERPHLCPFCSYRSARRDNLRSHARRVHKKDNLPCDTFTPRSMLVTPTKAK